MQSYFWTPRNTEHWLSKNTSIQYRKVEQGNLGLLARGIYSSHKSVSTAWLWRVVMELSELKWVSTASIMNFLMWEWRNFLVQKWSSHRQSLSKVNTHQRHLSGILFCFIISKHNYVLSNPVVNSSITTTVHFHNQNNPWKLWSRTWESSLYNTFRKISCISKIIVLCYTQIHQTVENNQNFKTSNILTRDGRNPR